MAFSSLKIFDQHVCGVAECQKPRERFNPNENDEKPPNLLNGRLLFQNGTNKNWTEKTREST